MHLSKLFAVGLLLSTLNACQKDSVPLDLTTSGKDRASRTAVCSSFMYADSVVYLRNQTADYVVSPVTALAGTYGASPWGLSINPATGAINVSKSETGLTYKIFYVKTGTADTCTRTLTIAGIDFASSVYFLSKNNASIKPTYRGLSTAATMSGLNFDPDGLSGSLPLRSLGIAINQSTGSIDLKQTVLNGTFGLIPASGVSRTVRLYYTVDDASKKALNHIDLRLTYYAQLSDVPVSLLSKVGVQNARKSVTPAISAESDGGVRPPDIVIVGH